MAANVDDILQRMGESRRLRMPNELHWRNCFDVTFPLRGSGLQGEPNDLQSAADRRADLLDSTGTDACRTLISAILSGMVPESVQWEKLEIEGASQDESLWLDEASEKLWKLINASNFAPSAFDFVSDIVAAGWAVLYVDEGPDGFSFDAWPISQCYVAASKKGGAIDTVYREWELTAGQAVAEYGADKVSPAVNAMIKDGKPETKVCMVRAIYPRHDYVGGSVMARNLPIASCTLEKVSKHLVVESGYQEMPCIVPRWAKLPDSEYAVGPAFDALPDLRMLQRLKFNQLAATDLAVGGMYKAVDDGVLNAATVTIGPRKIIVMNDINSMAPLETGSDFNVAFTTEERLQAQVRRILMADQLAASDGPQMTATEVHVRVALIRQLLGPIYGRLQSEWLKVMVVRCFGLAFRAGALGSPPGSLQGRNWTVKYTSPLALAQSLEEVTAMDRFETALIAEAQFAEEVLDTYDWDMAARERSKKLGVPQKLMRDPKVVQAMRDARAQAAQKEQAHAGVQDAMQKAPPTDRLAALATTEMAMQ